MFSNDQGKIVVETDSSKITDIQASAKKVGEYYEANYGDELIIEFDANINAKHKRFEVCMNFFTKDLQPVSKVNAQRDRVFFDNPLQKKHISVRVPTINFMPGVYYMQLNIFDASTNSIICKYDRVLFLKVKGEDYTHSFFPTILEGYWEIS